MSWRRLTPLVLVGVLGVSVAAAAALGAAQSPTSPVVLSPEAQSKQFHSDVARTLTSKSFVVHFAGQTTVYQAPNRTEPGGIVPGSFGLQTNMVTVGSSSYIELNGQWSKVPFALPGLGDSSEVLAYLRALSSFKTAKLEGDSYIVRGVLSDLPKALVTLIFTVVTHGPNDESGATFDPSHPNEHARVVGRVIVDNGRVTSETFTALGAYPSRKSGARSPTGTVTYSRFDSSPVIAVPTKADLTHSASPCGATAGGSCQVTTKGAAPHSALCKALRAHGHNAQAQEVIAQAQAAPKLRQWSAIKKTELAVLTLEQSLAQAVERTQHTAPHNIQGAAIAETEYVHEEKLDLLNSKSFSQFSATSTSIVAKMIGAFETLVQYEGKECGGTTTTFGEGSGVLEQGSAVVGQPSTDGH